MSRSAKIVFKVTGSDYLLYSSKRSPRHRRKDGKFELFGGAIEKGEKPKQALVRELREEDPSGTLAAIAEKLGPDSYQVAKTGRKNRDFVFVARISPRKLARVRVDRTESAGIGLLESGQKANLTPRTLRILKKLPGAF